MNEEIFELLKDFINLYLAVGVIFIICLVVAFAFGIIYLLTKIQELDDKRFNERVKDIIRRNK